MDAQSRRLTVQKAADRLGDVETLHFFLLVGFLGCKV